MPAKPLNEHELQEAAKLKRLFGAWQEKRKEQNLPASQEEVASLFGLGQSALSQYLNGKIPLNFEISVVFARVLGARIDDFSPTFAELAREALGLISQVEKRPAKRDAPRWMPVAAFKLLDLYYSCDDRGQADIMDTAIELSALQPRQASIASNDD
jgi:transcriptional regulator with XRE-family HTH domain